MKRALTYLLLIALLQLLAAQWAWGFTLVIDAGHGGHDPGTVGSFLKEKDINLRVALAFGRMVEKNCRDVKVIYTRTTDVFVPLQTRADIANHAHADLFISIHTNSVEDGHPVCGTETYVLSLDRASQNLAVAKRENSVVVYEKGKGGTFQAFNPSRAESHIIFEWVHSQNMRQSAELARCIQHNYTINGRQNKGVKQADLLVLRQTSMPAVLTEVGFISTPEEEQFMSTEAGTRILATSIYNGFLDYRKSCGAKTPHHAQVSNADKQTAAASKPAKQTEQPKKPEPKPSADEAPGKKEQSMKPEARKPEPKKEEAKKTESKAKPSKPQKAEPKPEAEESLTYRIQFATTSRKIDAKKVYSGQPDVRSYQEGATWKHTSGNYPTYAAARAALPEVRKTYPDAFIVTFRGDKREK